MLVGLCFAIAIASSLYWEVDSRLGIEKKTTAPLLIGWRNELKKTNISSSSKETKEKKI